MLALKSFSFVAFVQNNLRKFCHELLARFCVDLGAQWPRADVGFEVTVFVVEVSPPVGREVSLPAEVRLPDIVSSSGETSTVAVVVEFSPSNGSSAIPTVIHPLLLSFLLRVRTKR